MSVLSGFNNLLDQFLDELVQSFPELTDLKTIQTLAGLIRRVNARLVLDNFLSVGGRYHEKVFNKDSTFFENLSNWESDPYFKSEFGKEDQTDIFGRLVVFKNVWVDLTDNNKETIWAYLQQLLIIGAKANNNPLLAELCETILTRRVRKN